MFILINNIINMSQLVKILFYYLTDYKLIIQ